MWPGKASRPFVGHNDGNDGPVSGMTFGISLKFSHCTLRLPQSAFFADVRWHLRGMITSSIQLQTLRSPYTTKTTTTYLYNRHTQPGALSPGMSNSLPAVEEQKSKVLFVPPPRAIPSPP